MSNEYIGRSSNIIKVIAEKEKSLCIPITWYLEHVIVKDEKKNTRVEELIISLHCVNENHVSTVCIIDFDVILVSS